MHAKQLFSGNTDGQVIKYKIKRDGCWHRRRYGKSLSHWVIESLDVCLW
jgi:hypothetical protein